MTGETTGTSSQASQGVPGWTWPNYIGWGWMIVQARMEADWTGLWDYAMPNPKASEETVARTEAQLGFRLPESYRGFLLASNGWPYFFQDMTTSLLSPLENLLRSLSWESPAPRRRGPSPGYAERSCSAMTTSWTTTCP